MSTIQAIISLVKSLSDADRETLFAAFAMDAPVLGQLEPKAAKAAKEAKEPKAEKKPRANAGVGTAWSAFTVKIQQEHKAEVDVVKADAAQRRATAKAQGLPVPDDTKGAHLHWCSSYKAAHDAEWLAFKAAWELEHPKGVAATAALGTADNSDDAVTVVDDEAAVPSVAIEGGAATAPASVAKAETKKRGPKKDSERTPEELAIVKAKRAAKKAEKASASNSAEGSRASSPPKVKDE
uniref:Uncharacterized protein n=1 Tax=viral metagenome TaxID=1070528 RepID=A0A6C0AMC8_9ZZZZ